MMVLEDELAEGSDGEVCLAGCGRFQRGGTQLVEILNGVVERVEDALWAVRDAFNQSSMLLGLLVEGRSFGDDGGQAGLHGFDDDSGNPQSISLKIWQDHDVGFRDLRLVATFGEKLIDDFALRVFGYFGIQCGHAAVRHAVIVDPL